VSNQVGDEVLRFRDGDPAARELLARRACRLALRTAAAITRSRDEAADIAQDVAVDVLCSLPKLRDPDAFDAWVHRITARHALRTLKRRRAARATERPLVVGEADEPVAPTAPDPAVLLDARSALAAALAELPPRQQLALALRYVHDLSDDDLAAALGCRVGTAHSLLSRGRAGLRGNRLLADLAPVSAAGGAR
jgi:RNA polymerase sigma factor (sigma-70 family)